MAQKNNLQKFLKQFDIHMNTPIRNLLVNGTQFCGLLDGHMVHYNHESFLDMFNDRVNTGATTACLAGIVFGYLFSFELALDLLPPQSKEDKDTFLQLERLTDALGKIMFSDETR